MQAAQTTPPKPNTYFSDTELQSSGSIGRRVGTRLGKRRRHFHDQGSQGKPCVPLWPLVCAGLAAVGSVVVLLIVLLGDRSSWALPVSFSGDNVVSIQVRSTSVAKNDVTVTTSLSDKQGGVETTLQTANIQATKGDGPTTTSIEVNPAATAGGAANADPTSTGVTVPADFDFAAYLKWNPELKAAGIDTVEKAHEHYEKYGHAQKLVYKDFNMTIRYTACGGCMNQHYSHIAALTLAHMTHATTIVWPAMQERSSFNNRYHPDATKNMQSWQYLDASTLWDLELIKKNIIEKFNIDIIKHPPNPPLPDMVHTETAFQTHSMDEWPHEEHLKFTKRIYIARHDPYMLARSVMDAGRQVLIRHGRHPTTLLVDLPCTLFMMDNRNLTVVEDVAKLIEFSPHIKGLADKVIMGIRQESGSVTFNGIHLRMEKDAADWAKIIGGPEKYWAQYKDSMREAGFLKHTLPLYVASGLLKASREDEWSKSEMDRLSADMVADGFTNLIVYKERYLTPADLQYISNEQSGLIDFIVMLQSKKLVGIGVSTFSFYLSELRIMQKKDPADTTLMMLSFIGTDELFFSCGVVAIRTRQQLEAQHRLPDLCRKPTGRPCFTAL